MLRNDVTTSDLTVAQIAAHLQTWPWNITRELQKSDQGEPGRLTGYKVFNDGAGRGGQWRIPRTHYLTHLGIPPADREHLGADGLPELFIFEHPKRAVSDTTTAAQLLRVSSSLLAVMVRQQRLPHVGFGRSRYFTHNQLERTRVLLHESPVYRARLQDLPPGEVLDLSYRPGR